MTGVARGVAADDQVHEEVVRGLSARGRSRLSGTLRATVFGANDGAVSNFALMLGVIGGGADARTVLLAGLSGLLAGALSMAAGEYVSMSSQREVLAASSPGATFLTAWAALDVNANELALVYRAPGSARRGRASCSSAWARSSRCCRSCSVPPEHPRSSPRVSSPDSRSSAPGRRSACCSAPPHPSCSTPTRHRSSGGARHLLAGPGSRGDRRVTGYDRCCAAGDSRASRHSQSRCLNVRYSVDDPARMSTVENRKPQ